MISNALRSSPPSVQTLPLRGFDIPCFSL